MKRLLAAFAALAAIVLGVALPSSPAAAASLQEITGFGTNPTGLRMYLYVPDRLAASPGLLVAVHYCTGSGPAFYSGTEFASLADTYGFIVIYPSTTRSGNCYDNSSASALTHDGNSDPVGIVSMVKYVQANYGTDVDRTFVTGASSGGMMTNVLLGDYPDVFAAGSAFMGVPFGCFAATAGDPTDPANQAGWNSACANGQVVKTAAEWGDAVRAAYPGYTGRRPRMQVVHGTADTTLYYANFGEEIKQWTNVQGVSQTPVLTDTPQSGWTRTRYGSSDTQAPVEGISVAGVGHSLPLSGQAKLAISFFGLDTTSPTTSPTASPSTTSTTVPPSGGCAVTSAISAWNTGLTNNVTITNTGTTTISGWRLAFTLPTGQTITNGWNATYSPTSGTVTATNVSYNGTIAPGASVTLGYQATHTGNSTAPTAFTLNGSACG
ncbi:PHB depolymerase family esterase [Actinoplanes sp. NPDC051851]|uniref:extracellular catalytic domain type 1 short-chain-length polyhydroxyalkanoate depolymerase n=1 Tax=Actinoplanes sp. NPDC051851 TaxID=3154753 RepID=UPI003422D25E